MCSTRSDAAQIDQFDIRESDSKAYGAVCSLYRSLLFTTHRLKRVMLAMTSAAAVSLIEDMHEHLQNCSESHFMSILPFDSSKTSAISYTHRTVKVFTATHQNKSLVKHGRDCGRNIFILFSRMYTLLLLLQLFKLNFLSNDHTTFLPSFNCNSNPTLFA